MENYKPKQHGCYAYFPGTGPDGSRCFDCQFFRDISKKGPCDKFKEMTGRTGSNIPYDAPVCKYFIEEIKTVNMDYIDLKENLKLAMLLLDKTEADVAEAIGVVESTVKRWTYKNAPEKRAGELAKYFEELES